MRNATIAIPFYRNSELVEPILSSLLRCEADLQMLGIEVLAIVDSPEDQNLIDALNYYQTRFSGICGFNVLINEENLGFLRSINIAFKRAVDDGRDVIILNSDVEVFPGAFSEMRSVAYSDHMIGFVSPRSNNATICSLPYAEQFRGLNPSESYENYLALKERLPRLEYVPVVVGFSMYVKFEMLAEFGGFDTAFGMGYNEENDLILRANRCGYRAVIANHAFVYHQGEKSFGLLAGKKAEREAVNAKLLQARFPEYQRTIARYFASNKFKAYRLLDSLVGSAGRTNVAFDLRSFRATHNGTFEAATKIILEFMKVAKNVNVFAICQEHVFKFHRLHEIPALKCIDEQDRTLLAAVIRIGQPFSPQDIKWLRLRSPVIALFMLDTIALDCAYLDDAELAALWQMTLEAADLVFYNSRYTMDQFNRRFCVPETLTVVDILHSTDVAEYNSGVEDDVVGEYILVVGNKFEHKFVNSAVEHLFEKTSSKLVILGGSGIDDERRRYVEVGNLSQKEVDSLYRGARCVCFPSHYEGFGFPVMNGLANRRPVVARRMPVYAEIANSTPQRSNLHFFETSDEMVQLIKSERLVWSPELVDVAPTTWRDTAEALDSTLAIAMKKQTHASLAQKIRSAHPEIGSNKKSTAGRLLSLLSIVVGRKWKKKIQVIKGHSILRSKPRAELALVKSSVFFDQRFYKETYRDVADAGADCVSHFCSEGWREGRNPSTYFDLKWYRSSNLDVIRSGMNPLVHYLCYGIFENRPIKFVEGDEEIILDYVLSDTFLSWPSIFLGNKDK